MPQNFPSEATADLESVVRTRELHSRPARLPDHALQVAGLERLAEVLAHEPGAILQTLCEVAQRACGAGSAGISLLSTQDGGATFHWPAISGAWQSQVGGGTPRHFGPCGVVLDQGSTQLFAHPENYYPYIRGVAPAIVEVLLAPFYSAGKAVGTVWVLTHDPARRFDAEDQRQLESVARFAAAAYQTLQSRESLDTQSRQLEIGQEWIDRVHAVLTASEVATWVWDIPSDRLFADANLARMFGIDEHNGAGVPMGAYTSAIHPTDREALELAIARVLQSDDNEFRAEYRVTDADGRLRWVVSRGKLQRDAAGSPLRLPGVIIDITERKAAENALLEADERKNEFLAMLAHELRNPLASISNSIQLLGRGDAAGRLSSIVPMMQRQSVHIVRLIDDLLDVSRVSSGKIHLRRERIELAAVLNEAIESNRSACDRLRHRLSITLPDRPVFLHADAARLTQVMGNLLNNACKFTDAGGAITVTAELLDEAVFIHVEDNGIGLSAAQLPRVFDLFAQADTSLGRSEAGLGIGLTLVKRMVELHDGSITVESRGLGHGARFSVRLPTLPEQPLESLPVPAAPGVKSPRRILLVDDNADAALSLAMLLEFEGHQVEIAADGTAALRAAAGGQFEVVLLDIGLPGMSGHQVAEALRSDGVNAATRLIALTGWGQEEARARSHAVGFDAHLVKPVDLNTLRALLA